MRSELASRPSEGSTKKSFFKFMLGAKASREVLVSRSFAACFAESSKFRDVVLSVIASKCNLDRREVLKSEWICDTEVPISEGRLDIELTPKTSQLKRIILENKVGAPLTREQMKHYRKSRDGDVIVAVTKRHPEAGATWLKANACVSMRWQDIHDALTAVRGARSKNGFLCDSFREYLEELDMAYRGVVTTKDLVRVGRLLRAAGSHARHAEVNAQPALRAALDVIGLLDDVITECYERAPELRDWGTWGPSYFKWQEGRKCFHHVAFRLKRSGWKSVAGAGFAIPDHTGKIMWCINYRRSARHEWEEENHYLSEVVGKGKSFDVARLAQTFLADISKVGMIRRN